MGFELIDYRQLNARQKELYNFQKLAGRLADYGYNCIWLSDDWQGADFLACHVDGATVLRVQLKARLVLDRKYIGKNLYVAFRQGSDFFIYPHDGLLERVTALGAMDAEKSGWKDRGSRSWPVLPKWAAAFLADYKV